MILSEDHFYLSMALIRAVEYNYELELAGGIVLFVKQDNATSINCMGAFSGATKCFQEPICYF